MNVDLSPDGKTIVFDLLGDLYTMPAEGGRAKQLTRGLALHLRPVWSPDGGKIACISDVSGSFHPLVIDRYGRSPAVLGETDAPMGYGENLNWTADGHYIVRRDAYYGLAGGEVETRVKLDVLLRFSPDGEDVFGLDSGRLYRYHVADRRKTMLCAVLPANRSRVLGAALSPDGRWLGYIADSNERYCLILRDCTGDSSRILIPSLTVTDPRYAAGGPAPHFCFSHDSKAIVIAYGGKIRRIGVADGSDVVIPFTADVQSDLGPLVYHQYRVEQDSVRVRYTRSAHVSPDGKQLVFAALDRLYIMDLPAGQPHVLAPQPVAQFQPVYSPDGKWIAYVSWCDTAGGFLWRVAATGGVPECLTRIPGEYQRPAWSPDGKLIAVVRAAPKLGDRDEPGIGRLELVPVDGGAVRSIADSLPLVNDLTFTDDGQRIYFTPKFKFDSTGHRTVQLVSTDLQGNDLRVIATGEYETHFQQKSLSPDGRYLVCSADEDLYLVPVCAALGPVNLSDHKLRLAAIRFAEGVDPYWEKGGRALAWTYGHHFYRVDPDKVMKAGVAAAANTAAAPEKDFTMVKIKPDQTIDIRLAAAAQVGRGTLALKNIRIITMEGSQVIENGTIVIRDGRILAIGPAAVVVIPAGAKVLDLRGKTVMPGLIDLHLHMRVPSNVFPQQSWMFLTNLAYGVTTARDPSLSLDSYGYAEMLRTGQMLGPRLFTVGRAVRFYDGVLRVDSLQDALAVVGKRAELGGISIKQYELHTRQQRQWLLMACDKLGLNMTNEGADEPILQFAMFKDGSAGVEHNPTWGDVYKDIIMLVARSGTWLTPTLQVTYGTEMGKEYFKAKYWHQADAKMLRFIFSDTSQHEPTSNGAESIENILHAHSKDTVNPGFLAPARIDERFLLAGARIGLGSHGNDEGVGPHNELWALVMGGFTQMQALRAGTLSGAEALGVQRDLGSIKAGKIADLLILNKNPLEDIHNSTAIKYVMKDGILYDGDTLDSVWPVVKPCPEWKMTNQPH
jgi:Tol biopolymer transport system component